MNYKHCCVVDAGGAYESFILVLLEQGWDGETVENGQHYEIAESEQLIDANPPIIRQHTGTAGFITPKWDAPVQLFVLRVRLPSRSLHESRAPRPSAAGGQARSQNRRDVYHMQRRNYVGHGRHHHAGNRAFQFSGDRPDQLDGGGNSCPAGRDGLSLPCRRQDVPYVYCGGDQRDGKASIAHKLYHTTYCNHLFAWFRRTTALELAGLECVRLLRYDKKPLGSDLPMVLGGLAGA